MTEYSTGQKFGSILNLSVKILQIFKINVSDSYSRLFQKFKLNHYLATMAQTVGFDEWWFLWWFCFCVRGRNFYEMISDFFECKQKLKPKQNRTRLHKAKKCCNCGNTTLPLKQRKYTLNCTVSNITYSTTYMVRKGVLCLLIVDTHVIPNNCCSTLPIIISYYTCTKNLQVQYHVPQLPCNSLINCNKSSVHNL